MATVRLNQVVKLYDGVPTVHGIDLEIADGEFIVLVGPSGCGKSTTLRMIAGLESISSGDIEIGARRVNDLPPGQRNIAMVFQNYALYPHLSVADNIAFGLKLRKTPRQEIQKSLKRASEILHIEPLMQRKPRQLSGGQRQRVAMGRAIVRNPHVFLFDEPLSNLDAKLRVQMRTEIKQLHAAVATTTLYVTHDQVEAMTLADRVVVMNHGRVEQVDAPQDLYLRPASRFVAGFIGSPGANFVPARVEQAGEGFGVRLDERTVVPVPAPRREAFGAYLGREVVLGLRPEHFSLADSATTDPAAIHAVAEIVEPLGAETLVHVTIGGVKVCTRLTPDPSLKTKAALALQFDATRMMLIDPSTEKVVA